MKILPWKKKEPAEKTEPDQKKLPEDQRLRESLESAIITEWQGKERQFQRDVSWQRSRLEAEGFSADFTYKFSGFMDLMHFSYQTEIKSSLYPELMSQFKLYFDGMPTPALFMSSAISKDHALVELFSALPKNEWYKLQVSLYTLTRGAKELIQASPLGEAIIQYRQTHPFPPLPTLPVGAASLTDVDVTYSERDVRRLVNNNILVQVEKDEKRPLIDRRDFHLLQAHSRFGLQMEYVPMHLFGNHLRSMQAEVDHLGKKPYLHGSDAGAGDFYYAAFDLLEEEREFFNLISTELDSPNFHPTPTLSSLNLITAGNTLPTFYAQKFLDARKKLEKYGVDSLEKYFSHQAMGENGKEGKLRLFQPNTPTERKYRHYGEE